jgi:RimJ/RimL family protein N-acetyltransferase
MLPLAIPELTTDRLHLRAFRDADVELFIAMMADPEVAGFLGSGPLSRNDAWRQLAMFIGHWALRGHGLWAVEERATGEFIGRIGCLYPEGFPGFEIGYALVRRAWGRGYAREGAAAALEYAHEVLRIAKIISIIRPNNARSMRVAESLGAVPAETIEFFGAPSVVYRYPDSAAHPRDGVSAERPAT